jgi:predicted transcriptional regulator
MRMTQLHRFMAKYGITNTQLSKASGVSIRQVDHIKRGQHEPRLSTMRAILLACRTLAKRPRVTITDLFDFEQNQRAA